MNGLTIYCVTNKSVNFLKNTNYKIGWVGKDNPDPSFINCNGSDNIFYKEKYYSELTFHYWYWKNLMNLNEDDWVGFCQKRRFWIKPSSKNKIIDKDNIINHLISHPPKEWDGYDSVICEPINISGSKKIKLLKRGWKFLFNNPYIFFSKNKETISSHFDMHHGYGNLEKAINYLDSSDREEFRKFVKSKNIFNPHIMFISKPHILNKWFNTMFQWLERCENEFGFENLKGYDTTRLYAYLSERYLSFWFKKYTKCFENPWVFIDNN